MGLTTYLMQSVFGLVMFFGVGFDLLGKIGVAASVASAIAFFVLQIQYRLVVPAKAGIHLVLHSPRIGIRLRECDGLF